MAKSSSLIKLAALVFMSMLLNSHHGGAITCGEVGTNLSPCLSYLNAGGHVPSECCNGLKEILNIADTIAERQRFCSCEKPFFDTLSDEQLQRAAAIPGKCGVNSPFPVVRNLDCSKEMAGSWNR